MVEEVIVWSPNQRLRVLASEFGALPFRAVEFQSKLEPSGNGRSKVT